MRVLVAEDDRNILNGLAEVLEKEGYQCIKVADGEEALAAFREKRPEFVCLDIMMPKVNGYDVCRAIRKEDARVPVIFISAKSEEIDRVLGLELGADDYIMKPFGVREVIARIRAVTRRYLAAMPTREQQPSFTMGDLEVFPGELRARRNEETIDLSLRETRLLRCLFENQGRALDRNTIFDACWGTDFFANSRALDQHVSQLRKRIERDPKSPAIIRTVHGVGYRYDG